MKPSEEIRINLLKESMQGACDAINAEMQRKGEFGPYFTPVVFESQVNQEFESAKRQIDAIFYDNDR